MDIPQEELHGTKLLDPDWPFQGQIEFINVTLKYMPSLPAALHDLTFIVVGGTQVCSLLGLYYFLSLSLFVHRKSSPGG